MSSDAEEASRPCSRRHRPAPRKFGDLGPRPRRRPRPSPQACGMRSLPTRAASYEAAWQSASRNGPPPPATRSLPASSPDRRPPPGPTWRRPAGPWPPSSWPGPPSPMPMPPRGLRRADNPARHPVVAEAVKGWRNQAAAPRQAAALTTDCPGPGPGDCLRLPRRGPRRKRMESAETLTRRRAAVDLASPRRPGGRGAEAVGGCRPGLGRRRAGGRTAPARTHGPEGEEPSRARRQWRSPRPPPAPCATFSPRTPQIPPRRCSA